ncbi:MAG TPA: hypothetical protein VNO17_08650 [Actinomycetota bacterium]|nr:hypothetical protein [Actinomycetota bacterium]
MSIEDRLREGLPQELPDVQASEDAWASIETRLARAGRPPRESPRARLIAAGVALVVAALAIMFVVRAFAPSDGTRTPAAGEAEPAVSTWTVHTIGEEGTGISIETPQGWTFREDPLQIDMWPRILFAVGTYPFPPGGDCAPTDALEALPPDGMLLWVSESRDVHPGSFPPRPSRFELDPRSLANYECSGDWPTYLTSFRDGGRFFYAQVAFGPAASDALREEVLRSLDSLLVEPAGLTPDCPAVDAGYAPVVTPGAGPAGSAATVTGVKPPPYQEGGLRVSNWKIEAWWNLDPSGWASFATDPPPAKGPGPVVLLGEQSTADTCSYAVRFRVPDVPPGTYSIVVLDYGGGGAGPFEPVTFEVTG